MSNETEFVNGLIAKAPPQSAPEYVKAKLSIKRLELIEFLQSRDGAWINAEIKESRNGKWYVAIDSWKPESERQGQRSQPAAGKPNDDFTDDDIPF